MISLQIGDKAPDFSMPLNGDQTYSLGDAKGKYLVFYFYPKDSTPGCTIEARDFSAMKEAFGALNCYILGVSRDNLKRHENFISKQELTIDLGADLDGKVTEDYGVWVEKKMYGKTYMGIERATFLIGPDGKIAHIWRKVRVKAHVEQVLEKLRELSA